MTDSGTLPSFSLVDPNFDTESEENPQDLRNGEQMAAKGIKFTGEIALTPVPGPSEKELDVLRAVVDERAEVTGRLAQGIQVL